MINTNYINFLEHLKTHMLSKTKNDIKSYGGRKFQIKLDIYRVDYL